MADLNEIKASVAKDAEPVKVYINDKAGEPYLGPDGERCWISVLGSDAPTVVKARNRLARAARKRLFSGSSPEDSTDWATIEELLAAVVDWGGWESDGKPLPCEKEHVRAFLQFEHIRNQVWSGVNQHALFFGSGSEPSSNTEKSGRGSGSKTKTESQPEST